MQETEEKSTIKPFPAKIKYYVIHYRKKGISVKKSFINEVMLDV